MNHFEKLLLIDKLTELMHFILTHDHKNEVENGDIHTKELLAEKRIYINQLHELLEYHATKEQAEKIKERAHQETQRHIQEMNKCIVKRED